VIDTYALLNLWYPGSFPPEARFKLDAPPKDAYLNLREAAEYLGITTRRLKDLCRERRITHSRPDYRTYRFTRAELDAWLDQYRMHKK
jgi:excisionase family DNA binding protein